MSGFITYRIRDLAGDISGVEGTLLAEQHAVIADNDLCDGELPAVYLDLTVNGARVQVEVLFDPPIAGWPGGRL